MAERETNFLYSDSINALIVFIVLLRHHTAAKISLKTEKILELKCNVNVCISCCETN